jgi:PAS domain S-box-containing protein
MHKSQKLKNNDSLFHLMADHVLDGLAIIEDDRVVYVNNRLCEITGYSRQELMALDNFGLIDPDVRRTMQRDFGKHLKRNMFEAREYEIIRKDGKRLTIHSRHSHLLNDSGGNIQYHFEIITDITDRKNVEEKLKALNQELEQRVEERTAALKKINQKLEQQILLSAQSQRLLQEREQELEAQKRSLEDLNATLRVLLKKGEQDKRELEERTIINVKELVFPYLDRLLKNSSDYGQRECLKVIKSNLNDIISPFSRALATGLSKLTPKEIQIANLIREGRTTKEIAELLTLSERTITTHRDNIRKKVGLKAKKINLRTHLISLQ